MSTQRRVERGGAQRRVRAAAIVALAVSGILVGCTATPAAAPASTAPPTASTTSLDPELRAQLDAALDEGFAASGMPGVTVGLWIPGQEEWVATRGVSDLATNEPMDRVDQ